MDKEYKEKWLNALQSGEYTQGKGCLRTMDNKFCCLGVLADIVAKEHPTDAHWKYEVDLGNPNYYVLNFREQNATGTLPGGMLDLVVINTQADLIELNDAEETNSFAPVIEYIKNNL